MYIKNMGKTKRLVALPLIVIITAILTISTFAAPTSNTNNTGTTNTDNTGKTGSTGSVSSQEADDSQVSTGNSNTGQDASEDKNTTGNGDAAADTTKKSDVIQTTDISDQENVNTTPVSSGSITNGQAIQLASTSDVVAQVSVPRVIVTGYETDPAEVKAGTNFKLVIHLKNTSSRTRVQNMLFTLTTPDAGADAETASAAFIPSSGSNSIYLDRINAGATADISIELNAKADLLQKPYSIKLDMQYEDADGSPYTADSEISIPVKQEVRYEFGDISYGGEPFVNVGDECNVMLDLYNLGRVKLLNVKAKFTGPTIEDATYFIGNVDSGATAQIDAMLVGKEGGTTPVTLTLSYEDESGNVTEEKKEIELEVIDNSFDEEMLMAESMGEEYPSEAQSPTFLSAGRLIPILIGLAVIAAIIVVIVLIIRSRKKKRNGFGEEELLREVDRYIED